MPSKRATHNPGGGFRLVPKKHRRRLYNRRKGDWYWSLIRYSRRGPAGELRSIRGYLRRHKDVAWPVRWPLDLLIRWHLRTASDPPPKHEAQAAL
jgi:hypothetical protein